MIRNKAQMSLEYIVKLIILIVVAVVIINLILGFKGDIMRWWSEFIGSKEDKEIEIEPIEGMFSSYQIAKYAEACWSINKNKQHDQDCYFLMGTFSDVSEFGIRQSIDPTLINIETQLVIDIPQGTYTALVISYDSYNPKTGSDAIVIKG